MADESLFPTYLTAGGDPRAIYQAGGTRPIAAPAAPVQPQPFKLNYLPPPAPYIPPLPTITTQTHAGKPVPATTPLGSPPADNGLPKGVPANAIPVIRGGENGAVLSYDIPGTGQRLYPTLRGGASEYTPEQRFDLARYTEPAQIRAGAEVQSAGIQAGGGIRQAQIASDTNRFNTIATLSNIPHPYGAEVNPVSPFAPALPTYGLPQINPATGLNTGSTLIGAAAQRAAEVAPQVGKNYNAPDGVYGNITVKNKKIIKID